jgi:hypothetical protein
VRKLIRSAAYKAARKDLSRGAKVTLWYVEDTIRGRPKKPGRTWFHFTVPGFEEELTVVENGDLLIAFHELMDGEISLDLLIDRKNPPEWFHEPDGG